MTVFWNFLVAHSANSCAFAAGSCNKRISRSAAATCDMQTPFPRPTNLFVSRHKAALLVSFKIISLSCRKKSERMNFFLILVDALERLVLARLVGLGGLVLLARPRHLGQLGVDLSLVGLVGGFLQRKDIPVKLMRYRELRQ